MSAPSPFASPGENRVPHRKKSLTEHINAFGSRITRMISKESETNADSRVLRLSNNSSIYSVDSNMEKQGSEEFSLSPSPTMTDSGSRSRSRGRELHSSGRGGVGNIMHSVSEANVKTPGSSADEKPRSFSRGRDAFVSVGRGGAGNIRSPSKEVNAVTTTEHEREVIAKHEHDPNRILSTGRGGAGNIISPPRSQSRDGERRSASRGRMLHSSGRGGVGNIVSTPNEADLEKLENLERLEHHHPEGIHSTGRGGAANMTRTESPAPEKYYSHPPTPGHLHNGQEYVSFGRGGTGNIRSRSQSRDASRGTSRDPAHKEHGVGKLLDKVFHHEHDGNREIPSVAE